MASTPATMLKIVSSGLEDQERLNTPTGQPSTQFYKSVLRQRTRWASQWRRVEFDNVADFGRKATVTLPILGELITRATLVVVLPDIVKPQEDALAAAQGLYDRPNTPSQIKSLQGSVYPAWSWTNSIGHALCSDITFRIGNQDIDTLDSRLLEVIDEQHASFDHFDTTNFMIGRDPSTFNPLNYNSREKIQSQIKTVVQTPQTVQLVPPFWWNRGPGPQPLPIQALSKEPVQIVCNFRPVQECVYTDFRTQVAGAPIPNIAGSTFYYPTALPITGFIQFQQLTVTSIIPFNCVGMTLAGPGILPGTTISEQTDNNGFTFRISIIHNPSVSQRTMYVGPSASPQTISLTQYGRDPESGKALPHIGGNVVPNLSMPTDYHFIDAYWIVEYVSLEDREAAAFRLADLQIPIETHMELPVTPTNGAARTRIVVEQGGLVRDITWVAQRIEAPSYNAHFLFSQDLADQGAAASEIPWWPNAQFPSWDYGDGYIRTGFANARSDPLVTATFRVYGKERFDFTGPSFFRSLMPIMNCKRAPLVNRYIYRYDFGLWSTGGLADAYGRPMDEVRGCANWDKLPYKELEFFMSDNYYKDTWDTIVSPGYPVIYPDPQGNTTTTGFDSIYGYSPLSKYDQAYRITMYGAGGRTSGHGAELSFTIDNRQIQGIAGFQDMYIRYVAAGSISLVVKTKTGYIIIAVAGAGGQGSGGTGGSAGTVLTCGRQGGLGTPVTSHSQNATSAIDVGGGGGGGRSYAGSTGEPEGPGLPDGAAMTVDETFLTSLASTGGSTYALEGGDGYYGGGSGTSGGGGGGSYVSTFCTDVTFGIWGSERNTDPGSGRTFFEKSTMTIQPLRLVEHRRPAYNIHVWLTQYNMLRIVGGRAALMFQ
jgi:hypothetical protein